MEKRERLAAIRKIVTESEICYQAELLAALRRRGFALTQATLSRDLKQMGIERRPDGRGRPVYRIVSGETYRRIDTATGGGARTAVLRVAFAGNLCVVKTRPGRAAALLADIEAAALSEVIGSIASHDTIMIALEEGYDRTLVERRLLTIAADAV